MKMKKLLSLLLFAAISIPSVAIADPFQINFSGYLESLTQYGVSGVDVIDSEFTLAPPDNVFGRIMLDTDDLSNTTISLFELTIGSYSASGIAGTAVVFNDNQAGSSAPLRDSILIQGSNFTSTPIGGFSVDRLQFSIGTLNTSILDASSVVGPAEILALWNDTPNYFSGNLNFMSFGNGTSADETARFALTSVSTVAPVPEPTSLLLLGTGLGVLGLGAYRRRKK